MSIDGILSVLTLVFITLWFSIPVILILSMLLPFAERKNIVLIIVCIVLVVLLYLCIVSITSSLYGTLNTLVILLVQLLIFAGIMYYGYTLNKDKQPIRLTVPLAIMAGVVLGISNTPVVLPLIGISEHPAQIALALIISYAIVLGLQELLSRLILSRMTHTQKISWSLVLIAGFLMLKVVMVLIVGV